MNTHNKVYPTINALALAACLAPATAAWAECPTIDFENLAANTAVTSQYSGVTFSVQPQTCGGIPTLYMRIYTPPNGTSSGTKCIKIDAGCPDFSDDYLRMVFALPQSEVSFTLGDWATTYTVRYYTNTVGAGLIGSFNVVIPPAGGGDVGVHRRVTVTSASKNIRRIEVQGATSTFEAIDDLTFDVDQTPPIAEISVPTYEACDCDNSVSVRGRACDDDGVYGHDTLHYMPVGGTTWTFVDSATTPQCTVNGALYTWDTTAVADGCYFLRLTVENQCGLISEAVTVVCLDRTIGETMRSPAGGTILGGTVCIDGTVNDRCFAYYTADWKTATSGGAYLPVDAAHPQYFTPVINDPLAAWDTRAVSDGNYFVRLAAFDSCGHSSSNQVTVTVDNTAPTAFITSPTPCSARNGIVQVSGTASDAHLQGWVLQYTGDGVHGWVTIASGNASVVNGILALWDTTGLAPCAYALRLVVTDQSVLDCNGAARNQSEYTVTLDVVGDPLAQDTDADGMPDVWENAHGFNPNDPADATQDADKDGQTNLAEYLAGTDPRDPNSALRITAINHETTDVRVSWTTAGSHNYLLQGGTNLATGIRSNVSPLISIPPGGEATTNYLHTNGATLPARFYRVRLVP